MGNLKFRAWDSSYKKMTEPFNYGDTPTVVSNSESGGHSLNIDENTKLMQYIGIKDKHGVEIYEGDLLLDSFIDDDGVKIISTHEVIYCEKTAQYCIDNSYYKNKSSLINLVEYFDNNLEVCGNIYENPK